MVISEILSRKDNHDLSRRHWEKNLLVLIYLVLAFYNYLKLHAEVKLRLSCFRPGSWASSGTSILGHLLYNKGKLWVRTLGFRLTFNIRIIRAVIYL